MKAQWTGICGWIVLGMLISPFAYGQHQLIKNGDFANVFHGWAVNPELGESLPFNPDFQSVDLAPTLPNWNEFKRGPVISQPLNVAVSPGTQLTFSFELKKQSSWVPEGSTVAVYLETVDASGARIRERILHVPNSSVGETWTPITTQHFLPADRLRLVGLSLDKEGEDALEARSVSLQSPVAAGDLPELGKVEKNAVAYGETFVVYGKNLGSDEGTLLVAGSSAGVEILAWSDTLVQARLSDPSIGGRITLETAQGVRTWQTRQLQVISPYYTIEASPTAGDMNPFPLAALPGQVVDAAIFLRFFNGYAPVSGIALSFPDPAINGSITRGNIAGPGGSIVSVDTTGWAPGLHTVEVQADDGQHLPRGTTFEVLVKDVADLRIMYSDSATYEPRILDGETLTSQGAYSFWVDFFDASGDEIHDLWLAPITVSSSNPSAVEVFRSSGPFGDSSLLVHDSANDVDITVTLPDGRQFVSTLNTTIPAEPRITGAGFTLNPMSNIPGFEEDPQENENFFWWTATDTFSSRGASWSWDFETGSISGSGNSAQINFFAGENLKPGKYLWSGRGTVGGISVRTGRVLTVVNDPNTGLITGKAVQFGGGHGHGVEGMLELYDASSGDLVEMMEIYEHSSLDSYTACRVAPGSYRLRWIPMDWTNRLLPQWYPNAESFEDAVTVVVSAGSNHSDIDFLCVPLSLPSVVPAISEPPSYSTQNQVFTINIAAVDDVEYILEKSETMLENTWIEVDSAWGWEGAATLSDPSATGSSAFYRVRSL